MPLDDRDWYNPKEYRIPRTPDSYESIVQPQGSNLFMQLLLWITICAVLYGVFWLFNDYQKAKQQAQAATIAAEHWKHQAEAAQRQLDQIRKAQRLEFFKP